MAGPIKTMSKEPPERVAFIRAMQSAERAKAKARMEAATPLPREVKPRPESELAGKPAQPLKVQARPVRGGQGGAPDGMLSIQEWGAQRYPDLAKRSHVPRSLAKQLQAEYQNYQATQMAIQRTAAYDRRTQAMTELQPADVRTLEQALAHEMVFGKDPDVIDALEAAMEKFGGGRGGRQVGVGEASEEGLKAAAIQELAKTGRTDGPAFTAYQRYQLATKQPQKLLPGEGFTGAMVGDPTLPPGARGETIASRYEAPGAEDPVQQVHNWLASYRTYAIQGAAWPQRDRERMEQFLWENRPKASTVIDLFDAGKITETQKNLLISPEEEKYWRPAEPVPAEVMGRSKWDPFAPENRAGYRAGTKPEPKPLPKVPPPF